MWRSSALHERDGCGAPVGGEIPGRARVVPIGVAGLGHVP